MNILKKIICTLYILIIVCMGLATFIENIHDTQFVHINIYGTWWFAALWALLTTTGLTYIIKRHISNKNTFLLHIAFVIILLGAVITHFTSRQGMIHIRQGETTTTYTPQENDSTNRDVALPFAIRFKSFNVDYHEGTSSAANYETLFTIIDNNGVETAGCVSMNKIFTYGAYRLCQSSYDDDMNGSVLSMNSDPVGIPVTYTGYAMLFLALIYMLIDRKGTYRRLLRAAKNSEYLRKAAFIICTLLYIAPSAAQTSVPKETANNFGRLQMMYNGRICSVQTFAIDFTKKIYGQRGYKGFTAEQVLLGFMLNYEEWRREPIIKINRGELKSRLDYEDYCSVDFFFNEYMGGYIIGPYVREFYEGRNDDFHKQATDIDDKIKLIMDVRRHTSLCIFPIAIDGKITWSSVGTPLPPHLPNADRLLMQNIFGTLAGDMLSGNYADFNRKITHIADFQKRNGGRSLPSEIATTAERIYNRVPFATLLFIFNLTIGFVSIFLCIFNIWKRRSEKENANSNEKKLQGNATAHGNIIHTAFFTAMLLSFISLSLCLALRWIISGNIPMSNGYETMLLTAWLTMLLTLISCHRFRIMITFGFLISGFFLLASHISYMNPQIGQMMPVLSSPLLSIHVSIIMMAYAMLSVTFICGMAAIISGMTFKESTVPQSLMLLSQIFHYPALTCLGLGIFIGAIWANVSWGCYWSWDPKETWALITFMVYGVNIHTASLKAFRNPLTYHIYMVAAFFTLLMTYFGVNYILGGMHSYA